MTNLEEERSFIDATALDARDYWVKRLSGESWTSGLEYLPSRPGVPAHFEHGAHDEVYEKLRLVTGGSDFLGFVVVAAGLLLCLSRYSGRQRIGVATPTLKGARPNLVPLLGDVNPELMCKELLVELRASLLSSYARQSLPYSHLVDYLERDRDEPTLFDVVVEFSALHEIPPAADPKLKVMIRCDSSLRFELNFLRSPLPYSAEILPGHWEQAIRGLVSNLDGKLRDVVLSTNEEADRLRSWSSGYEHQEEPQSILELIARNIAAVPHSPALMFGSTYLTYKELDRRICHLERLLRSCGAGPERVIGVLMNRSPDLVCAILAILRSGAAFLPLDPSDPPQRLKALLLDSRLSLAIASPELAGQIRDSVSEILTWDEELFQRADIGDSSSGSSDRADHDAIHPEALAYVIYTSGSTGRPSGVMATHRGLSNYLHWCLDTYGTAGRRCSVLHTSTSFDLSLTSLFLPLAAGEPVILAPAKADGLTETLRAAPNAGVLKLAPAHLSLLTEELEGHGLPELQGDFVIGGEALSWQAIRALREHCPSLRLFNEYGPTETVVGCCVEEIQAGDHSERDVPIGRPISGASVWVLDEEMRAAPAGTFGEIFIGGAGVARGYWARPDLTALKFVPDPFAAEPGGRLYRTGDRGYYLPDGRIAFAGRRDGQVKIRGYRVELGEVEQVLMQHPAVRRAVVLAKNGNSSETLAAYCTCTDADRLKDWREFVAVRLPGYMVPGTLRVVEEIPLTTNGKVNRAALLALGDEQRKAGADGEARSETERKLVAIWSELMERNDIGIHDDFFELGGHSLFAARVLSRIRHAFDVDLSLRIIFESPTIAGLAKVIETQSGSAAAGEMTIVRRPRGWAKPKEKAGAVEGAESGKAVGEGSA